MPDKDFAKVSISDFEQTKAEFFNFSGGGAAGKVQSSGDFLFHPKSENVISGDVRSEYMA